MPEVTGEVLWVGRYIEIGNERLNDDSLQYYKIIFFILSFVKNILSESQKKKKKQAWEI